MRPVSSQLPALKPVDNRLWQRHGMLGWWVDLTAPPRPGMAAPVKEQERVRKAELTSLSLLAVFLLTLALVSNSLANAATAQAVSFTAIGLTVAAFFNRRGWTRTAAYLVPSIMMAAIILGEVQLRVLSMLSFPLYDLSALPILISGFIADRRAPWILALIALAFTLLTYSHLPHELLTGVGASKFDVEGYELNVYGWWGLINRDVALILFAALFSWLGALSVERAIVRADRSDEIARLREQEARKEAEQAQALNDFVQELIDAFAAQANGQTRLLAHRPPTDQFSRYVHFINERLQRFEQLRRQQGLWNRGQVVQACALLSTRIQQVRQGWLPPGALAPHAMQTGVEVVDDLAVHIYSLLQVIQTQARQAAAFGNNGGFVQKRSTSSHL